MSAQRFETRLHSLIKDELAAAIRLRALLDGEQQALAGHAHEDLAATLDSKQRQLILQQELAERRNALLQAEGFAVDSDGVHACLDTCSEETRASWDELMQVISSCQQRNRANGALVELSRRNTQRALDVLTGRTANPVYDAAGSAGHGNGGHTIGKA